eukprot:CAMPEP_0181345590 /NCGR_PEP_ID=MMETSP1101-20121128/32832_1 /TAXON_ID=46948 /ORGANISM="Rhodomonas abbreviata, Strain Caron Lab Isolate" /LENGTH=70 /DNA_ID=CAMNT_0023457559 /DNA_START=344 /DNA_END=556 /DNA_ORIENTATION=+
MSTLPMSSHASSRCSGRSSAGRVALESVDVQWIDSFVSPNAMGSRWAERQDHPARPSAELASAASLPMSL